MHVMSRSRRLVTLALLGAGLLAGGLLTAAQVHAATPPVIGAALAQQSSLVTPSPQDQNSPACDVEADVHEGVDEADADNVQHEDTSDAGDMDSVQHEDAGDVTTGEDNAATTGDDGTVVDQGCQNDQQDAAPGTLEEGKDLLPQAKITVEQAVTAAQQAAQGALGAVDLERENGTLVYHVSVGDQDVSVDATTGLVLGISSEDAS